MKSKKLIKPLILIMAFVVSAAFYSAKRIALYKENPFSKDLIIVSKNYYLLAELQQNKNLKELLGKDSVLRRLCSEKKQTVKSALDKNDYYSIIDAIIFSESQYKEIKQRLSVLYDQSSLLQALVMTDLIPSGRYSLYDSLTPKQLFLKAFNLDMNGINTAIAIYGEGSKPHYPSIDSISFNVNPPNYINEVRKTVREALNKTKNSKLFFELSMQTALCFLKANGREDAADYEPMEKGVNKAALKRIKETNWTDYPYTVLLVPGEGPESSKESISPGSKLRCQLVAKAYKEHLAPFIIVSGGKVHPYKTRYCEAEEMKRYLMDSLHIEEDAIIMEPHARHTTTNMRNAVREMIHYQVPMDKPGLIISDKEDNDYITQMDKRCQKELGYIPYKLGKRIADDKLEFYGVRTALQINSSEPLDP